MEPRDRGIMGKPPSSMGGPSLLAVSGGRSTVGETLHPKRTGALESHEALDDLDAKAQQSNRMGAPGQPAHSGTAATSKQAPVQLDKHPYSKTSTRTVREAPVQ